jgi:phage gpG-like protein
MPRIRRSDFPDFSKMQGDFHRIIGSLPAVVGNAMVNFYQDSWAREGFLDQRRTPWPARASAGAKRRRLLVQTGRLRRSIRYRTAGTTIHISTDVPYAQIHNEGGQVSGSQNVKAHTRRTKRGAVSVKAHSRMRNFTMPQRQFMDIPGRAISATLEKRIRLIVQRAFDAALTKRIRR